VSNSNRTFGGQDVAVFIDFENIYISVVSEYEVNPDFDALIDKAEEFGRVAVAQAYADWTPYSHYINSLHAHQIDPMYVPAYHYGEGGNRKGAAIKNSVDMFLCINAMKMLYSHPNIQTFVLVTGDRDFVPLIRTIREFGKRAVVIGVAGAASSHLAQAADEFFFYHQITDNLKPPEKEKPKPRDPFDVLVEAVKLARQRSYIATVASLKLLMTELQGDFDPSRYKDSRGRPLQKFKDFLKEAERRGKVKISAGAINEVFLPNEDPRKVSPLIEEVAPPPEPVAAELEAHETEGEGEVRIDLTRDQWKLFIVTMAEFDAPVPFVRVFDSLRGLRNQNLLDLSNKQVKDMVIKAIHLGLLTRNNRGRGRRTMYQLTNNQDLLGQYVDVTTLPNHQPAQMPAPMSDVAPHTEVSESIAPSDDAPEGDAFTPVAASEATSDDVLAVNESSAIAMSGEQTAHSDGEPTVMPSDEADTMTHSVHEAMDDALHEAVSSPELAFVSDEALNAAALELRTTDEGHTSDSPALAVSTPAESSAETAPPSEKSAKPATPRGRRPAQVRKPYRSGSVTRRPRGRPRSKPATEPKREA
jgi:uncharacterized LabA/DUF88 family protein